MQPRPASPPPAPAAPAGPEEPPEVVFFDPGSYAEAAVEGLAGSAACAECHEAQFRHWQRTPHARALVAAGGAAVVSCRRCHASLLVCPEEDAARLDLDLRGVGCEACHGPARAHVEDPWSAEGGIIGIRDDCPECNFRGICQVCHNTEGDPDFRYFAALRRVRHPEPGENDNGGEIPLEGAGGPACRRAPNR